MLLRRLVGTGLGSIELSFRSGDVTGVVPRGYGSDRLLADRARLAGYQVDLQGSGFVGKPGFFQGSMGLLECGGSGDG